MKTEKILYASLGFLLIFGITYFVFPLFKSPNAAAVGGACTLDSPNPQTVIAGGEPLLLRGWAFDKERNEAPTNINLTFISTDHKNYYSYSLAREERKDVNDYFKLDNIDVVGFTKDISAVSIEPGDYQVFLNQKTSYGLTLVCDLGKRTVR